MAPNEFQIGRRYRNREQAYEVLNIEHGQLRARYDDGHEGDLDPDIAARIHTNIQREEAGAFPRALPGGREQDFAWSLGIIAHHGDLQAEVPPQSWGGFVQDYRAITHIADVASEPGIVPITIGGYNKWGSELRIYIPERLCTGPRFVLPANLNLVAGHTTGVLRINNNEFWWFLVDRLGFRAGRAQDTTRIEARLPHDARQSFRDGLQQP